MSADKLQLRSYMARLLRDLGQVKGVTGVHVRCGRPRPGMRILAGSIGLRLGRALLWREDAASSSR